MENKSKDEINDFLDGKERRKIIKEDGKEMGKIIFMPNEEIDENWADQKLSLEEVKILSNGERYIKNELISNLEINIKEADKKAYQERLYKETTGENKKISKEEKAEKVIEQQEKEKKEQIERQFNDDRQR